MRQPGHLKSLLQRLHALWLGVLRRILHWWVRSTVLPEHLDELGLDPDRPVFYVLDTYALSSLLTSRKSVRALAWPRPSRSLEGPGWILPRAYGASRRSGVADPQPEIAPPLGHAGTADQAIAASGQGDAQIVPVNGAIGRAPPNEDSLFKLVTPRNWMSAGDCDACSAP